MYIDELKAFYVPTEARPTEFKLHKLNELTTINPKKSKFRKLTRLRFEENLIEQRTRRVTSLETEKIKFWVD